MALCSFRTQKPHQWRLVGLETGQVFQFADDGKPVLVWDNAWTAPMSPDMRIQVETARGLMRGVASGLELLLKLAATRKMATLKKEGDTDGS